MATSAASKLRLEGLPIVILSAATVTVETGTDSDKAPSKRAVVHQLTVNGQEVDILIRVQKVGRGLFIDLIADSSIANLVTRATAMSLAATSPGHPSPTKDTIDTQALTDAGG